MAGTSEVLTIGETMAMVTPIAGGRLDGLSGLGLHPGGAESNVAASLAQLGAKTAWASAVGADALGEMIVRGIRSHGVDVSHVRRQVGVPTGVYFKDPQPEGTDILYYRRGSAASRMNVDTIREWLTIRPKLVHVSGITPALSASCSELIRAVVVDRVFGSAVVSFDVNHRPSLWDEPAGPTMHELASHADVVFVGRDEAQRVWGTTSADEVHSLLPHVRHLVVKDADVEAVSYSTRGRTSVASRHVEVVDPLGAGDAFAAGWLMGHLREASEREKLSLGHWTASQVLRSPSDLASLPGYAVAMAAANGDSALATPSPKRIADRG